MQQRARNILVVDDHADTLQVLVRLLISLGHHATPAASCAEARQVAEAWGWGFDMLLCDVGLPDGDGAELMAEFKRRCGCTTIALTAHGMADDLDRYTAMQVDRCLVKPIAFEQLKMALNG